MKAVLDNWLFWSLLSAVFAGATAVLAKVGVGGVDPNIATAIRTTVVLVFTWILAATVISQESLAAISRKTWFFLVLSGIATGLSWVCYFHALQVGKASQVAPVDKLSVVFAIALAAWFLHEPLTWHHWVGGFFIVCGAIVIAWK